jgi:nitrogen-specific signal transduction histidine kinase
MLSGMGNQDYQVSDNNQRNITLKRRDCSFTFPVDLHIKSIKDRFGRTTACNITFTDQTISKNKIEQAEKDKEELKRKERLKDEFITVASHELKTPIQPILGYALLARKGMIGEEKAWDGILREARRLQQLVNDILDTSRIESGGLKYYMRKEKINLLLDSIADSERKELREGVKLLVLYDEAEKDLEVELDRSRITQVITNLLSNAMKFTDKGAIIIHSKAFPAENELEIRVSDTGKGISEQVLPGLFERFATNGHGNAQNNKGTGLGLYISKAIVEGHKGKISGYNEVEGGATFLIRLPISQRQQDAADAEALIVEGMNFVSKQQLASALEFFEQAIKLNPNNSKAWYNKGMCLMTLKRSKEDALYCFDKSIEINPLDAEGWNNKGAILEMFENDRDALTCYERALELRSGYSRAWQNKGRLLQRMGNGKAANECFKKACETNLQ